MSTARMRRRRLLLWGLLAAGFLFVNFHRTATAVLAETLAGAFDTTAAELGFLHASFFWIYAGLQLPAGLVVDRYGPRWVAGVGLAVMTGGVAWFASAGTLTAALAARATIGLGGSVLYVATLRYLASWYRPDEYATMTGLTIAAAGIGGILATTPLALAIEAVGWRTALLAAGGASGVVTVGILAAVRDRPADAGLESVGTAEQSTASLSEVVANTRTVLGERETWLMGLMLFFVLGANFTVLGLWGVPFVVDIYGTSVAQASTYVLLGNVGFVLGSPVFGWLSDRLERRTSLIAASTAAFTLSYVALVTVPPLPVVGAALFCALFANGGVALAFTVGKERHDPEVGGTVTGVINSLGYFGAAVLPAVMGVVLDAYWTGEIISGARVYTVAGYRVAFGIAALAGLLATGCAAWLHHRESGTQAPTDAATRGD
ncbi:MFS transporter [Halorarius halobius]|uniref:MFS transporter n=1 Tax=Halorarius halobius TaxID=2962671 RepID=UPI0020CE2DC3|nr:MFS transporter [Halorarius halobius]